MHLRMQLSCWPSTLCREWVLNSNVHGNLGTFNKSGGIFQGENCCYSECRQTLQSS